MHLIVSLLLKCGNHIKELVRYEVRSRGTTFILSIYGTPVAVYTLILKLA